MPANFQGSSFKTEDFFQSVVQKLPLFATLTPPSTKGGGYFFLAIWQKSLINGQFACMQIFRDLASKLRISSGVSE